MSETVRKGLNLWSNFTNLDGKRIAIVEDNIDCNRHCKYCRLPSQYSRDKELTLQETFQIVDWIYKQGFPLMTYLGGESFAPFITKEGMTFAEYTLQTVNYASSKGLMVNVVSNGDYLDSQMIIALKKADLDSLSLSLHSLTKNSLNHLIKIARQATQLGIISTITTVITSENASQIPDIATQVASHGILFGYGLVQTKGNASTDRGDLIPSFEQQKELAQALIRLKQAGFIRNNTNYIEHAQDFYPNKWVCNPEKDAMIHIGWGGTIDVCTDFRTGLHIAEVPSLSTNELWREKKRLVVKNCGGCLYQCSFEAENPNISGDLPMIAVGLMIRTGQANMAKKLGSYAVNSFMKSVKF